MRSYKVNKHEITTIQRIFVDFMLAGKSTKLKKELHIEMLTLAFNKPDKEILDDVCHLHKTLDAESYMINFIKNNQ